MNLNKYTDTTDSQLLMFAFSAKPLQVFIAAFERYKVCLTPLRGEGNITIEKELELIDEIANQLHQKIKIANSQGDAPIRLFFINWCLFTDVLFKYAAIKTLSLKIKREKVYRNTHRGRKIKTRCY